MLNEILTFRSILFPQISKGTPYNKNSKTNTYDNRFFINSTNIENSRFPGFGFTFLLRGLIFGGNGEDTFSSLSFKEKEAKLEEVKEKVLVWLGDNATIKKHKDDIQYEQLFNMENNNGAYQEFLKAVAKDNQRSSRKTKKNNQAEEKEKARKDKIKEIKEQNDFFFDKNPFKGKSDITNAIPYDVQIREAISEGPLVNMVASIKKDDINKLSVLFNKSITYILLYSFLIKSKIFRLYDNQNHLIVIKREEITDFGDNHFNEPLKGPFGHSYNGKEIITKSRDGKSDSFSVYYLNQDIFNMINIQKDDESFKESNANIYFYDKGPIVDGKTRLGQLKALLLKERKNGQIN